MSRVATGVVCALLAAPAAVAQPGHSGAESRIVRYTAADLVTPAGAERLAQRIRHAADHVCGGDSIVLRSGSGFYECRRRTVQRAVAELNAPLVAARLGGAATDVAAR